MASHQNLHHLQKTVANADTQLNAVAIKLNDVEKNLTNCCQTSDDDDNILDDVCVMELLDTMTEVKNEYQNLRKDIKEVQQLQKEMTNSLRYQLRAMQQTFNLLKKRIELKATQN